VNLPAEQLFRAPPTRDSNAQAARLAQQFVAQNVGLLANLGIAIEPRFDGTTVKLSFRTGTRIGAIPLLSPTSGKPDCGLIVKPRFEWPGIGAMLGVMGWRVIPAPLRLPLLPWSERKIPPWVLSSIVLFRLQALVHQLNRRFEMVTEIRHSPRGNIDWTTYATKSVSRGNFMSLPCRFPDLRDDRDLKAAIAFTLRKLWQSLEGQRTAGVFVLQLIATAQHLLQHLGNIAPKEPSPLHFQRWFRCPLHAEVFRNGLQAIEWTVEDRGLAGLSDLQGLPWVMPMEAFFEAWTETVFQMIARRLGGMVRTGRQGQTIVPLQWEPPYFGSQKYLLPDLILESGNTTIIVDAKYKSHWEEMSRERWGELEAELREHHRADLLQILAYANIGTMDRVIVCLAYPCRHETWQSLKARGRLFHRASISAGKRQVVLLLTAIPMCGITAPVVNELSETLRLFL
jgi:5-methylcytosine-specific restriction endonuclease McrBC regulatory subunit McrC